MQNAQFKGAAALLGGAFVVSTFGLFARLVAPMFGVAAQNTIRFLLAAVMMAGIVSLSGKAKLAGYTRQEYLYIVLLGLATFGLGLLFVLSVTTTKVANTFSLIYAGSILTSFIAGTFFLHEKVTPIRLMAIIMALVGLVMYSPGLLALHVGLAAGIAAGFCDGLSNIFRKQLRTVKRDVAVMYQYALAGLFTLPLLLVWPGGAIRDVSSMPIIAMVAFALVSLVFGKLLLYGFSRFDVNVGGVILAMQIFFAMILGFIFFKEVPSMNELFGSLLIFLAVLFAIGEKEKLVQFFKKRYH